MIEFAVDTIYSADDGVLSARCGRVQPLFETLHPTLDDLQQPLVVDGIHAGDFAVFATGIRVTDMVPEEVGATTPYLVTERRRTQGILVPWNIMAADMRTHATERLARTLQQVPPMELVRFQIGQLTLYLNRQFPPR